MLDLSRIVVSGAIARDESRGAHYKPPPRSGTTPLAKTTLAEWTPEGPRLSYAPVDTSILKPVERKYA